MQAATFVRAHPESSPRARHIHGTAGIDGRPRSCSTRACSRIQAIEGGCGNLRNGTKVRVVADQTQNADSSFTAQKVTIVDQPGGRPPASVAGEGVVGARKGECPSLTMVVHGYPVMTTSFTTFEGDCEAVVPGTRIRVEGVLGGNSVVADSVEIVAPATTP